jgi:hypothetical protein
MSGITRTIPGFAFAAALALVLPTQALSQEAPKAGVVTTLQGTASVARSTQEPRPLKFKDDVFVQDRITTGDDSIVRILLGGKAVVTVRERSVLTISETPTTATIEVGSGKVAVAVAKERMRAGDSVEVKTPNAVAGIRGTILIAEVAQESASRASTQFTLLTGIVDVSGLDAVTGRAIGPRVTMQPLQTLGLAGFTRPSAPRNISRADAQAVASAYKVSVPAPPAAANAPMVERQVEQGIAAAAALVPVDPKVKVETKVDAKADPKSDKAADVPTQDVAVDDGKGDKARKDDSGQSGKDRKASTPGSNSGGGREVPAPGSTSGPAPSPAPSGPAPTAPVPTAPTPTPPPVAANPPAHASPPPPALPPVASIPGPGTSKKGGLLDDVVKKLPKLPKPPRP